jgi:hypothetical protein
MNKQITKMKLVLVLAALPLVFLTTALTVSADTIEWKGYNWEDFGKPLTVENDILYTQYYAATQPDVLVGEFTLGREIWIETAFIQGGNSHGVRMSLYGFMDFGGEQHYTAMEIGTMPSEHGFSNYGARYIYDHGVPGQHIVAQEFSDPSDPNKYKVQISSIPVQVKIHVLPTGWMDLYMGNELVWSTQQDARLSGNTHLMDSVRYIHLNYGSSGYTDFKITEITPEPSTFLLFGSAALGGLGFLRFRRKKHSKQS